MATKARPPTDMILKVVETNMLDPPSLHELADLDPRLSLDQENYPARWEILSRFSVCLQAAGVAMCGEMGQGILEFLSNHSEHDEINELYKKERRHLSLSCPH